MTKAMRELLARRAEAEERAREAVTNGTLEEIRAARQELEDINERIKALEELEAREEREFSASRPIGERREEEELVSEYKRVFAKTLRNRRLTVDEQDIVRSYIKRFFGELHEGGGQDPLGDASVVVPIDMQTRINELIREQTNLNQYVRVEPVTTLSGTRVLEVDADSTPFAPVDEYEELQETDKPQFRVIEYAVKKYGGFLPITKELAADNDANLLDYVVRWLGKKVPATYNNLILNIWTGFLAGAPAIADMDEIKRIKNMELDPAIANRATWFTNQDGYNWLDTLQDNDGRYLLKDDIAVQGGKMLLSRPVVVVPNKIWPSRVDNGDTFAPLLFGDMTEAIVHFQRQGYELASTEEGGEAWRRYSLEMRAILRSDFQVWDHGAVYAAEIQLP